MLKRAHLVLLNTSGADGFSPPVEFRLFRRGVNETSKGSFIFDDQAAANVLAHTQKHGTRIMLDLEHLSVDQESRAYDPDPRGWCSLEVRNGELWAVGTEWLADGERRLRDKLQPYVSPTFDTDAEGRVTRIYNIAMTAMPATFAPAALVAASQRIKLSGDAQRMDPELVKKAMEALAADDAEAIKTVLQDVLAAAASGGQKPADAPPDPSVDQMMAEAEAATPEQALSVIKAWKKTALEASAAATAAALSERKSLAGKLVTLGAETPATAYVGEGDAKRLADRLLNEPIESLRARVTALSAAKKSSATPPVKPAVGETVEFSPRDIEGARKLSASLSAKRGTKVDVTPAEFVALKNKTVRTS